MDNAEPERSRERSMLLILLLHGWLDLLNSRETILRKAYRKVAGPSGTNFDGATSLAEVRQRVLDVLPEELQPSAARMEKVETRMVAFERFIAIWKICWMSILPLLLTIWLVGHRIGAAAQRGTVDLGMAILVSVGVYFGASFLGMFLLVLTIRPIMPLLEFLFRPRGKLPS